MDEGNPIETLMVNRLNGNCRENVVEEKESETERGRKAQHEIGRKSRRERSPR